MSGKAIYCPVEKEIQEATGLLNARFLMGSGSVGGGESLSGQIQ